MLRLARLDAPGVLHHVIIRGIRLNKIFRETFAKRHFSKSALICPISASGSNFNPRNIKYIYPKGIYYVAPVVEIFAFLELEQKLPFCLPAVPAHTGITNRMLCLNADDQLCPLFVSLRSRRAGLHPEIHLHCINLSFTTPFRTAGTAISDSRAKEIKWT